MAQGFQYGTPVHGANLLSSVVRTNFQALSTFHKGPLPPSGPKDGWVWIDDADAANVKMKLCKGDPPGHEWVIFMVHLESFPLFGDGSGFDFTVEFYEGSIPPLMINLDDYNFEDAAGFNAGVDQDIIFRIPPYSIFQGGLKLRLQYFMSTAETQDIVLKLDYRVKVLGDLVSGGTDQTSGNTVITPVNAANQIAFSEVFTVPGAHIPADTERINFRLSRKGAAVSDDHTGQFCLMSIRVEAL